MNRIPARCAALAWLILASPALARPDENDVYVLRDPEHTLQAVEKAYSEMPPVTYQPPADRWKNLPVTASVLAKETRDRYMRRVDALHPGWEFAQHVGYSTPEHRGAIERLGVSPLHRMSFASTAYTQLALG